MGERRPGTSAFYALMHATYVFCPHIRPVPALNHPQRGTPNQATLNQPLWMSLDQPVAASRTSYEVELSGAVPIALRTAFPVAGVRSVPAETVLTTEIRQGAELDALLDKVLFMGLVLTELHEQAAAAAERRVAG